MVQSITSEQRDKLITALSLLHGAVTQSDIDFYSNIIALTNIGGCSFVRINDYNSDKSDNTELASYTVNIGASYENQKAKDAITYEAMTITDITENVLNTLKSMRFDGINISGQNMTLQQYKDSVIAAIPQALKELKESPKDTQRADYNIYFNKALRFNTNTLNWLIYGTKISKDTTVKGIYKPTKKAPKTLAKELIKAIGNVKTNNLRTFNLDNVLTDIRTNKQTIDTYFVQTVE